MIVFSTVMFWQSCLAVECYLATALKFLRYLCDFKTVQEMSSMPCVTRIIYRLRVVAVTFILFCYNFQTVGFIDGVFIRLPDIFFCDIWSQNIH